MPELLKLKALQSSCKHADMTSQRFQHNFPMIGILVLTNYAQLLCTFPMSKVISTCLSLQRLVPTTRAEVNVNRLVLLHGEFLLLCALVLGHIARPWPPI